MQNFFILLGGMLGISIIGLAVAIFLGRRENEVFDFDEREIYHD